MWVEKIELKMAHAVKVADFPTIKACAHTVEGIKMSSTEN